MATIKQDQPTQVTGAEVLQMAQESGTAVSTIPPGVPFASVTIGQPLESVVREFIQVDTSSNAYMQKGGEPKNL